jgi:aminoglycoside phosphotransferase (APT) family kinase protein
MRSSDLEALALRYVPGPGTLAIDRIGAGLVNESYRVARGSRVYSLRVPASHAVELGLDRAWECRVLERAAAAGLAPVVERCEPREGILVARWVDGRSWTPAEVRRAENIEGIAQLARRIHALPMPQGARAMSPSAWIAQYHAALRRHGGGERLELGSAVQARLAALAELPPPRSVLCHSDLHPQNVIAGNHGLLLLDWEYAHVAEPWWDLAGWIGNNDLSSDSRQLLLASYLNRQSTATEAARLQLLVWLYDYVCLLWSELYLKLRPGIAADGIAARTQLLTQRLAIRVR